MGKNRTDLVFLCALLYCRDPYWRKSCLSAVKTSSENKNAFCFQEALGSRAYEGGNTVANDAIGIAFLGLIAALAVSVAVKQLVKAPGILASNLKYLVLAAFVAAAGIYWIKNQKKTGEYS